MKKIYLSLIIILAATVSSCDMNKDPYGILPDNTAIESVQDCRNFRVGLYATMRGLTTGGFIYFSDLQTDLYHSVTGTGNVEGSGFYNGSILPAMSELETYIWGGYYSTIGSTNLFITKADLLLNSDSFTSEEKTEIRRYIGEAMFIRAYCYYYLAERFCKAYGSDTANAEYGGVPIVTTYDPTSDNSQYPARNTLAETYAQIKDDLTHAGEYIDTEGTAMSPYVTRDAVKAMQARVALAMKNYTDALSYAEEVINSRRYSLAGQGNLDTYWTYDYGDESIWLVTMTGQNVGLETGIYFLANTGNPPFIPTQASIDLFDAERDFRYNVYFAERTITITGSAPRIMAMAKYPGNPNLNVSGRNYFNMGKPFRIAEQYLIAAEAAAELSQDSKANRYLNDLKARRISGYSSQQHSGVTLRDNIREERRRELFGEGFRLGDLKRWGLGFSRSEGQNNSIINTTGGVHRMEYEADDYRFVWPIPKAEIDANPQIKNHQNPGY